MVDAADYIVWRKTVGNAVPNYSGADGDGDGTIDQDDYNLWRANFGQTLPSLGDGAAAFSASVEPAHTVAANEGQGVTGAPVASSESPLADNGARVGDPMYAAAANGVLSIE